MSVNVSRRGIGINFNDHGTADVSVWAPLATKVEVVLSKPFQRIGLEKHLYGYWKTSTSTIKPGTPYKISVDGKDPLPDPASLYQPAGVHGHSEAFDITSFKWTDHQWHNLPLPSYLIYELHVGTFSPSQNFDGVIDKLDYLLELGVNAIEVMPVAQFPGTRNWGYDGVYPFAVQDSYGGPAKLQELVDECHRRGIAVVLDVIYNHLGPEGNYFGEFGPYFTEKYRTPWGKALNFDDAWCNGARDYFIENALMWFRDFHIDALRMDAVHAIRDFSPVHLVRKIRQEVNELSYKTGRPYYMILELDLNDPNFINPQERGGFGADTQWIDEFHHALRVSAGQPREGYYSDFNGVEHLAKSFNDAYVYDGQFSEHRKKFFGMKTENPGHQFVVFSQNHDHIGNRMFGERTSQLVSYEMCKLMAAAVMVSPYLPMLFMGEEWAETNPFMFFISHTDKELAANVNKGRKEEFSSFNWPGEPPDPRMEETFFGSMLQWNLLKKDAHHKMFLFYQELIRLRKNNPALCSTNRENTRAVAFPDTNMLRVDRHTDEQKLVCMLNFSKQPGRFSLENYHWKLLLDSSSEEWNGTNTGNNDDGVIQGTIQPESILIYASTH